jgi:photosystem II stability/assembly factor-like uncharacterized protein
MNVMNQIRDAVVISTCPMLKPIRRFVVVAVLGTLPVFAQEPPTTNTESESRHRGPAEFKHLKYRAIGPAQGGRVSRVAGVPGDPATYYAATASGGVWKSTDGGVTFKSIFDDQPISSIGSIAVAPSDPNVVYVGSGEANIRGNVAAGNGIYKSSDAGKTWTHVWKQEGQIGAMVVHRTNADIAYAAVLGHAFGPNAERGVYRTHDGGKTWQQVLKRDQDTGASDVALDPSNPRIVFAGLWQARRRPWEMTSGGPGSGLHVSRDGGDNWKQLTGSGLPEGVWGKVGVAVAPSDGRRVYALIEADEGGLFRSDDGGDSWRRVSAHRALRQRAWYYTTLTVNPQNPDDVWFPQVPMLRTIDGGRTIRPVRGIHHGDHHDLWIDPVNPRRMIGANDGGVDVSIDGGTTWFAASMPIGQFYHVSVDTRVPYHISGAMQDLGTTQGPSNSLSRAGIVAGDWHSVGGGEAGHVVSDPSDPNIVYAGEYLGYISRYDHRTRQARNVRAWPDNPSGYGGDQMRYRFQWTAPIAVSPHDPKVVYHGAQVLFRTADGGQTWRAISPDLTRADKSKQKWSGGPITGDNTGVETYCTIFAVAESPKQKGLIWIGSDDGLLHVTRDGGATWKNVTAALKGAPEWGTVSLIEPSPFDAGAAYVVFDAHRLDDMRPYLFRTTDFGETWTRLDAKLPQDVYLHAVREDPKRKGTLYLGTERGVMYSSDAGTTWRSLQLNLPTVAVHDLVVAGDDLVLGTHGRGIWILDDLTPVRQLTTKTLDAAAHLFDPSDAIRWRYHGGRARGWAGEDPPRGAIIYYFLKEKPKGEIALEIRDAQARVVRRLSSTLRPLDGSDDFEDDEVTTRDRKPDLAIEPGVQRAVWDLRHEGARKIKGAKIDTGDPSIGPLAVPGKYTVTLVGVADARPLTAPLTVKPDPLVSLSQADYDAQLTFALQVRDEITRLTTLGEQLRSIRQQLRTRVTALGNGDGSQVRPLIESSDALVRKLDALEARLHNPAAQVVYDILAMKGGARVYSRLSPLLDWVSEGDGPPTQGVKDVYEEHKKELDRYAAELKALVDTDLARLNELAKGLNIGFVTTR